MTGFNNYNRFIASIVWSIADQSSGKAEDLPISGSFLNPPPSRFILKFFRFFRTLPITANNIHSHLK